MSPDEISRRFIAKQTGTGRWVYAPEPKVEEFSGWTKLLIWVVGAVGSWAFIWLVWRAL